MTPEDAVLEEHAEVLPIWSSSEDLVLVVDEHEVVVTKKCLVLKAYLAEAAKKYSQTMHLPDQRFELLRKKNEELVSDNQKLKNRFLELTKRIDNIEKQISDLSGESAVIVLREITREEAKEEIRKLFIHGRVLYYSDIARELRIDLELVVEICREMIERGEIEVNDDALQCG